MTSSELEMSQTYRSSFVAKLPKVYTGTKSELNFPLMGLVTLMAYSQCTAIGIAKPRRLREA
jgi:hypothetical protein